MIAGILHAIYVMALGLAGTLTVLSLAGILILLTSKEPTHYGPIDMAEMWFIITAIVLTIGGLAQYISNQLRK